MTAACSVSTESDGTGGTRTATGGERATGGTGGTMSTGGMASTGGTIATGGIRSTGGVPATGGVAATGGAATGGVLATGGASSYAGSTGRDAGRSDAAPTADASAIDGGKVVTTGKFAGNITTRGAVRSDFSKYWDQITPENEGKWGSVQRSEGQFSWSSLDAIYKYANENKIIFKQHTFVWGAQQPGWVNNSNGQTAVRAWMKAFCERYPETKIIDVVNEPPPHTTPTYKDGIGGAGTSGWDWIANAFKWAREFCPNAILVLNDYNTIELSGDNNHIIDITKKIKGAGAPIDAVGAQAHGTAGSSADSLKKNIDNIATQTGLPVYITEFDLSIADDNQQKSKMQEHFTMFWNNPNVKGITIWGYIVGATWVANSGLIRADGSLRPAMTWLMTFLNR